MSQSDTVVMNVLLPTDFSENSWNAIEYALSLFKEISVQFHILHVKSSLTLETDSEIHSNGIVLSESKKLNAGIQMNKLLHRMRTEYPNDKHTFHSSIQQNSFIKEIRNQVQEKKINLIVMGNKGATRFQKSILGSNTGAVITKVKCSVLLIPENSRYEIPKHIAFPTDFNIVYKSRILESLQRVSQLHTSLLSIMYVGNKKFPLTETQQKNKTFLFHNLEKVNHTFCKCYSNDLELTIQKFVEKKQINMIAMVAKNLNFFQRIFFKPTVEKINYHTKVPFLVLHE